MVTSVTGTSTNTTTTSASGTSAVSLAKNFDTFLKLLTTQLKNQDPTSPMDTKEFTNQLVQFSQVEQQINQNKNLETLIGMYKAQTTNTNIGYIGKEVVVEGNKAALTEGGKIDWMADIPTGAAVVKANIYDSSGKLVQTKNLSTSAGRTTVQWDGSTSAGTTAKPGTYSLEIVATDTTGKAMTSPKTYTTGTVDSVEFEDGAQYLVVKGNRMDANDVVAVRMPQAAS
jgi:flagellar basal-body rod modification protein FlgD